MRVAFGTDHAGFALKEHLTETAKSWGHEVLDLGTYGEESVDYPDYAAAVARAVVDNDADLGIVLCSNGVGVSITANKVVGVRAALCHTPWGAKRAREHADANVLALGAWEIGRAVADEVMLAFLEGEPDSGGRHEARRAKMAKVEARGIGTGSAIGVSDLPAFGKKTVRDVDVAGKTVLVRSDLNVPIENGVIGDDTRLRESLGTVRFLLERDAKVVLCSHLGRPSGRDESLSLAPVAGRLGNLLEMDVLFAEDCVGPEADRAVATAKRPGVVLLENLRFHDEEERNDRRFAEALASLAEVFVNDAFGAAHRAHASTAGVAEFLPAVAGLLMEKEVRYLSGLVQDPPQPFAAVVGGAKVSSKIAAIEHLLPKLSTLLLGGGMANTFLKASGKPVGMSLTEDDLVDAAAGILSKAREQSVEVHLPVDVVVAERFAADAYSYTCRVEEVPDGFLILDIGPQTVRRFSESLRNTAAVVWNGPMGVFEMEKFSHGSLGIAKALAELEAVTVVGGGETAAVVAQAGLGSRFTHVSTGGGASLEMLEGRELPGVSALMDA